MIHKEISDKRFQMDSLDGLRGFAALVVVFSHTSNSGMFFLPFFDLRGIGKSGVFLFFLLSAFLLILPLLKKGREVLSFPVMSHYWQRRFFRIYPLYTAYLLLAVVSTLVIGILFGKDGVGIPFALDWYGFFNHLTLQESKGVTWSIAVEFKFYFILPIFVLGIVLIRNYGYGNPPRTEGGHRIYQLEHVKRLSFIRRCRGLGFSIQQIHELLRFIDEPDHYCGEVKAIAMLQAREVQRKINDLKKLLAALHQMVAECQSDDYSIENCPII